MRSLVAVSLTVTPAKTEHPLSPVLALPMPCNAKEGANDQDGGGLEQLEIALTRYETRVVSASQEHSPKRIVPNAGASVTPYRTHSRPALRSMKMVEILVAFC